MYQHGRTPWAEHAIVPLLLDFFKLLKKTNPKAKILDIGCGNGWISIAAAKKGFEVWGIDSSSTAIKEAMAKAKSEGVDKKTDFKVGDALRLSYGDNYFDSLIDIGLFHHILPENRPLYLKNIQRVLKPDAIIYLSVFSTKNPEGIGQRFTKRKVEEIFSKHFKVLKFKQDHYSTRAPRPHNALHFRR